jgi:hypothetical protein
MRLNKFFDLACIKFIDLNLIYVQFLLSNKDLECFNLI